MLDFRTATFLAVTRTMNFTHAAKELNITQPAVSQHIRCLENHYGVQLFEYRQKHLSLTPAGEILMRRLSAMRNDESAIRAELETGRSGVERLSLGVTMTIGEYAIVKPLAAYLKRHPDTNVHLHYGNTRELLGLLDDGEVSMALVEGNYPKSDYSRFNFSAEDYIGVVAARHRFASGKPRRMQDLTSERLLLREAGSGTRNILESNLASHGIRIEDFAHYTEVENMHTLIGLLKEDCGISFMYKIAVADALDSGELKEIQLEDFSMRHDFDFIWTRSSIYSDRNTAICREFSSSMK